MLDRRIFCFLNETYDISNSLDWNNSNYTKLWLYNLHYFDDLTAVASEQRTEWHQELIDSWINENQAANGNGWEPYPSSLRIVNWIKWALAGNQLNDKVIHSLIVQVRFLTENLETHLLGNHLFANTKALLFAGLFFDGKEAEKWYRLGHMIVERELPEQVLADGGNFELSTMYHMIFLEDVLDLMNIHSAYDHVQPNGLEKIITPMFNWLNTMCHPDGEISFFNDAAIGVTPPVREIKDYGCRLGLYELSDCKQEGISLLTESGYARVQADDAVALIDRAKVGPDYLPAHAHADTLSFELSLFGQRVIINSGTSVYGAGTKRQQERSTSAHATVEIDGLNSSEVWGGFRVARRACVNKLFENKTDGMIQIGACHDGYKWLPGKPEHCREWIFEKNNIVIKDVIKGKKIHQVKSILPLHPNVEIISTEDSQVLLDVMGNKVKISIEGDGKLLVENSKYHPGFGLSHPNKHLVYSFNAVLPNSFSTRISW
ncbi:MAG: heparinase II/III family protein [Gammaproteobacteria bacterium]|nr:heparinase II/III family protein [Gammaproteobacteria bacterium]